MDKFKDLTTGAKLVLGATVLFLIVSFFNWFEYDGPGADEAEAVGADLGVSMWNGIGWIAGLLAIALIVWQALRLANLELEIGVTPAMITAALAVLMLIFTFIRWIDKPGGDLVGRTFWAWLGLALAIVVVIGAWMNMQAAGEGLADVRDRFSSMTAGSGGSTAAAGTPAASTPEPTTTPPAAAEPEAPAAPETPEPERPAGS
jgi:hypothetical protein